MTKEITIFIIDIKKYYIVKAHKENEELGMRNEVLNL